MPGRQRDDQIAMKPSLPRRRHDQTAIRSAREGRDGALDLAGVAHVDRVTSTLSDGATAWMTANWPVPRAYGGIPKDRRSRHAGRDLL